MNEITMIDYLALRLGLPRVELRSPTNMTGVLNELLVLPAGQYPVKEWNIALSYLYRDHYYFSSIERARDFVRQEIDKSVPQEAFIAKMKKLLKTWRIPLACGLIVFLLMQHIFMFCFVPSASMEPAIQEGSFIFASRIYGELDCNDIIVFDRNGTLLVKRIIAVSGDTVYLNDETGVYSLMPVENATRALAVPAGSFFVVGDNEENSLDSRFWEDPFVLKKAIRGIVLFSE